MAKLLSGTRVYGNLTVDTFVTATGNVVSTANVTGGNLTTAGLVTATGNITGGNILTVGLISATSTITSAANVVGGNVTTAGLVTATGNITGSNILTAGLISATGNITGGNILGGANVNATTHTGTTVSVSANITGGNLLTAGIVSSAGNALTGNLTVTGNATVTYAPATTVGTGILINAANTIGGTGYADFLRVTNTSGGATNPNKTFRINSTGNFEIINSAYSTTLSVLDDGGNLTIAGSLTMNNRPAFRVYGNGTTNINATNTLTGNNFAVDYQQGSALNTSTGIFTAPYAGLYQINLVARYAGNVSTSAIQVQKTSGATTTQQIYLEWAGNSTAFHMGGASVTKLAVNDTLKLVVTAGSVTFDANDSWSVAYIG